MQAIKTELTYSTHHKAQRFLQITQQSNVKPQKFHIQFLHRKCFSQIVGDSTGGAPSQREGSSPLLTDCDHLCKRTSGQVACVCPVDSINNEMHFSEKKQTSCKRKGNMCLDTITRNRWKAEGAKTWPSRQRTAKMESCTSTKKVGGTTEGAPSQSEGSRPLLVNCGRLCKQTSS